MKTYQTSVCDGLLIDKTIVEFRRFRCVTGHPIPGSTAFRVKRRYQPFLLWPGWRILHFVDVLAVHVVDGNKAAQMISCFI